MVKVVQIVIFVIAAYFLLSWAVVFVIEIGSKILDWMQDRPKEDS
jgi:hypothetical protein